MTHSETPLEPERRGWARALTPVARLLEFLDAAAAWVPVLVIGGVALASAVLWLWTR